MYSPSSCREYQHESADQALLAENPVAILEGFDDSISQTNGIAMATAKSGSRIAVATWNQVLVYAFSPRRLATWYPISNKSQSGDLQDDLAPRGPIYRLTPARLPVAGVVFSLAFVGEYDLVAWTDRGLVRWYFGAHCNGRLTPHFLPSGLDSAGITKSEPLEDLSPLQDDPSDDRRNPMETKGSSSKKKSWVQPIQRWLCCA